MSAAFYLEAGTNSSWIGTSMSAKSRQLLLQVQVRYPQSNPDRYRVCQCQQKPEKRSRSMVTTLRTITLPAKTLILQMASIVENLVSHLRIAFSRVELRTPFSVAMMVWKICLARVLVESCRMVPI